MGLTRDKIKNFAIGLFVALLISTIVATPNLTKKPLHEATYKELIEIQAVGEVKANLILSYIKQNPDCEIEDLEEIKGVSTIIIKRIEKCYR